MGNISSDFSLKTWIFIFAVREFHIEASSIIRLFLILFVRGCGKQTVVELSRKLSFKTSFFKEKRL